MINKISIRLLAAVLLITGILAEQAKAQHISTFRFLGVQQRHETGWGNYKTLTGDVNNDGLTDLIWNETGSTNRTYVGLGQHNGTFVFLGVQQHPETGWGNYKTLTGDVNNDGLTDLIWNETGNTNRIYVGLGKPNGSFLFLGVQQRLETGWSNYKTLTGDVNGDGLTDLIWNETGNTNRIYVGLSHF